MRRETRRENPILAGKPDKKGRETGRRGRKEAKDPLRQNGAHMKKEESRANDMTQAVATQEKGPSIKNASRVNGTAKEGRSREVSDPIKSANKRDAHLMPEAKIVEASPGKMTNRVNGRMVSGKRIAVLLLEKMTNHVTSKKWRERNPDCVVPERENKRFFLYLLT
ncbi:hypothetical protein SDC9_183824 [bioreactor metagenome]|uniref:Uncharacterized protein n=1 Tax=bioreactor metagenome TaxID=1076179 RepID=A0A645HBB2_9ZZZZ